MTIEKVNASEALDAFIESEQQKYEEKHGIVCNYTPFHFVAKIDDTIVGAISGATFLRKSILLSLS